MASCAVTNVIAKDPRFQELREMYKKRHYSDDHLAQALQLCREYHAYDDNWFPETPAQKGVFTRFMNHYLTNAKVARSGSDMTRDSVYNLYTTLYSIYTPEQLDARVNMFAKDFRSLVDRIEREDKTNRSRQELIELQGDGKRNGFVVIADKVFDIYEKTYTDPDKMMEMFDKKYPNMTPEQRDAALRKAVYRAQEYKTILANKERIAALASTRIGEDEGFVVNIKDFKVSFDAFNDDDDLNDGNLDQSENNGEDREEGSKGDRYGDFRTLKLINTLSVRARRLLSEIPKVNSDGKVIRDDLGFPQYIGGRQAAVVLKRALVNSSSDTIMSDLRDAADFYPWLNGLIDRLEKDPDLQATVYDNFKNAETTYVYVNLDNGRYAPKIANSRSQGYALMREAGNNLRAGYILDEDTSIYTGFGSLKSLDEIKRISSEFEDIKRKVLNGGAAPYYIRMVDGDKPFKQKTIDEFIEKGAEEGKDYSYLKLSPVDAMTAFLDDNPELPGQIAKFLRGIGFAVSEKDVRNMALQTMTPRSYGFIVGRRQAKTSLIGRNKLYALVGGIAGVLGRAQDTFKTMKDPTGQYLYNTSESFRLINSCLALTQYDDVEARVVNEGKSLSAYNNVNLLHQTIDRIANRDGRSEDVYQEDLENEFLRYEGMALGFGERRILSGWLKELSESDSKRTGTNEFREQLRVVDCAAFNHVEYANLSNQQKLTNSIIMYFGGANLMHKDDYALYEVPIQADYSTAYNFIHARRYKRDEIIDNLTDEVLMELERIAAIEERIKDDSRIKLNVYEKQGLRLQIFPELNDSGFKRAYTAISDAVEARNYVRQVVAEQIGKQVSSDFELIENLGILTNPAMDKVDLYAGNYGSLYAKDGKISSLDEESRNAMTDMCMNIFYARQQMTKILTGGLEQFNGLIDFEKRNMLTHATRSSLYENATWKGKKVGKKTQNVVYIEDDESASKFLDDIKEMLQQLLDDKVISKEQFDTMSSAYSKIKTTDGQGFRTLESYRIVQIMSDQWDDRHESAYQRIMSGKPLKGDIDVFMQNIKPVLTGYEDVPAYPGQKPVKLTVLHKYSETVLLPMALSKYALQTKSAPLQAFEKAQMELRKNGKEIDMFLFHSGVKVGAYSILNPFAKDKTTGERLINSVDDMTKYIVNSVNGKESVIHTLPFKYYGIAASTPAHVADDRIAWASQAEKVAWANISDGDEISVRGEKMSASDARELYNNIKTAGIIEEYKKLRELFVDSDELEKVFQEELANKSYSSNELKYALAHLKDGTFAIPLFSPNIEHQVQELLASIIKKRLTKPRLKGANILQSTGLGMDMEASPFDNTNALSEDDKLKVVFDGDGKNKRIKYVEVFMPIHDSRLRLFADSNGNIGPDRLRELVDNGTIPESALEFIAYRTPSDAEHSVIPCRIKGFVANVGGATIKMPKEIMVMTGHDYDGDKMRCHFKDFRIVSTDDIEMSDEDVTKVILGQKDIDKKGKRVEVYEYDYNKSPLDNSPKARANARVELMFSQLTSPSGSRRVIIPGGCDETKVIAKSLYLTRAAADESVRTVLTKWLGSHGLGDKARSVVNDTSSLYDTLIRMRDKELTDMMREVSGLETPFSLKHSVEAFDYIMGGSEMIGIYALYNSAFQMMQRLNMSYVPALTKKGKPYEVKLFNHTFGKLFDITNHRGRLASLSLARLLNAAVDNNKDPILGYLNQTKEMSEMTFLMLASGMTEEEVHLIMNQPAVIELIHRLKGREQQGLRLEAQELIDEIAGDNPAMQQEHSTLRKISDKKSGQWVGLETVGEMTRDDFTDSLATKFQEVTGGEDMDLKIQQIAILQTLIHLNVAADNLASFVRLTRPESESGAIGTTVADIIAKVTDINKFREKLDNQDDSQLRISGMRDVMRKRDVDDGWTTDYINEIIGSDLPEVVALNSLMIDSSLQMFSPYFPQARRDWADLAAEIADDYSYKKIQEGTVSKIVSEMILWKLLSNKRFITGNPQEEQKRIIIDVPKQVRDLKIRVAKAEKERGKDPAADQLIGNIFLGNLTATSPEESGDRPRLRFSLNGPAVEGTRDAISASWGDMLNSDDDGIRKLAIDLFKYNLYTNGFTYGMYEFSHFAPFSVLMETPGYIEALQDVLKSNWNDDYERENFINQYYMNHWGDKKFIPKVMISELKLNKLPDGVSNQLWIAKDDASGFVDILEKKRYVVVTSGEKNAVQTLYRVLPGNSDSAIILEKAVKLGSRNRGQQVTLQYNPTVDYRFIEPVVTGNDSAWGNLDNMRQSLNYDATGNIEGGEQREIAPAVGSFAWLKSTGITPSLAVFGVKPVSEQLKSLESKAESQVSKNEDNLPKENPAEEIVPPPTVDDMPMPNIDPFGLGITDMSALKDAVVGVSKSDDNTMLNIVRRDENGNIVSDKVGASPDNIRLARKQKVFVELNRKLREILRDKGVDVGVLSDAEARMSIGGISDFDTAKVTAEGLIELIRIAEGYEGEQALPEEFAHVALEMLGHDNPLVERLLNVLNNSDEALEEAYDGMYDEYAERYGAENKDKLVLEAAGKLVAKSLFRHEEIRHKPVRRLIGRIIDAIKSFFRKFRRDEIQNAIFDAEEISSKIARELLGGKIIDELSLGNISQSGQFQKVKKDLTNKEDILSRLLKTETKRLAIFKKRIGYSNSKSSKAVDATQAQITKLEAAIRNYKTEDAIVSYLNDSLNFLAASKESFDKTVNGGYPANSVCHKLNIVRDTLYSFSKSIEDIREAIRDGEVLDDQNIESSLAGVSNVLANFYQEYEKFARIYFEEMLTSVYGEHGKTVTVGREKGRVITIHEMARKADKDISLASRIFNSLADCNDYALKAFDDVVRSAKLRARRRATNIRPKIESAIADLYRETGSRDQSFMFETEVNEEKYGDNKRHRTGKYISEEASKQLSDPKKKFYDTMMAIKSEADLCVPESLLEDRKIVMLRKYTMDRFKSAEGAKGKAIEAWEGLKNRVMDTSDNFDPDNHDVAVDFEGNRVDMLPVKFLLKGKNESYDDMSDDVATSMMAYAGMAFEYNEMHGVVDILENAKYMASERDVIKKTGRRTQRESIDTGDISFTRPFTVKQAKTNIQRALEDFFQMHVYGHIQANEGTIGGTRVSKRKVVDMINSITSYSQMAINLPQRIANINTGLTQIVIESAGKGVFNVKDVAWASGVYMKESGDRMAETGKTDFNNKLSLWDEYFDVHQDNGRYDAKYKKGRMSRIFNSNLLYAGMTIGEDYLASVTSLAAARNFKVKDSNGKEINLWDAYEVKYTDKQNKTGAYLSLKDGVTKLDGSELTFEDEQKFAKQVAGLNFELQGIYNLDDRSAIQQYAFGALIIMYRKWIAPAIKRRYSSAHYNALKGTDEEGYHNTLGRLLADSLKDAKDKVTEEDGAKAMLNIIADIKAIISSISLNWDKFNDYEKSNVSRACTELAIVLGLFIAAATLGKLPPDDHDGNEFLAWADHFAMSQLLRLRAEIGSQAPTPMMINETLKILNSPFAAIGPVRDSLKVFQLLLPSNYVNEVQSGRYRGRSKAYKYFRELPIISMFKKVDNFIDPSPLINYYKNDATL